MKTRGLKAKKCLCRLRGRHGTAAATLTSSNAASIIFFSWVSPFTFSLYILLEVCKVIFKAGKMENKMHPLTLVRSAGQNCYGGNEGYTISSIPLICYSLLWTWVNRAFTVRGFMPQSAHCVTRLSYPNIYFK